MILSMLIPICFTSSALSACPILYFTFLSFQFIHFSPLFYIYSTFLYTFHVWSSCLIFRLFLKTLFFIFFPLFIYSIDFWWNSFFVFFLYKPVGCNLDSCHRNGQFKPVAIGEDGKPRAVENVLQFREEMIKSKKLDEFPREPDTDEE